MDIYERKINYYETDKMGVVHHSNYIRFFEEARCQFLEVSGLPYDMLEEKGIMSPVLGFSCQYKQHVTFGDIIEIQFGDKISRFEIVNIPKVQGKNLEETIKLL